MEYVIDYANGRKSTVRELDGVISEISASYPEAVYLFNGDTSATPRDSEIDNSGRILVWADEASSVDDDGARAIASIYRA